MKTSRKIGIGAEGQLHKNFKNKIEEYIIDKKFSCNPVDEPGK